MMNIFELLMQKQFAEVVTSLKMRNRNPKNITVITPWVTKLGLFRGNSRTARISNQLLMQNILYCYIGNVTPPDNSRVTNTRIIPLRGLNTKKITVLVYCYSKYLEINEEQFYNVPSDYSTNNDTFVGRANYRKSFCFNSFCKCRNRLL